MEQSIDKSSKRHFDWMQSHVPLLRMFEKQSSQVKSLAEKPVPDLPLVLYPSRELLDCFCNRTHSVALFGTLWSSLACVNR